MASNIRIDQGSDPSLLRGFGLMFAAVIATLFGILIPWLRGSQMPYWPWLAALVFAALAVFLPRWLGPVYRGWMAFGATMNRITTPLILGIVFFGVLTPFGLVRRVLGKDNLARTFDRRCTSYRKASARAARDDMEHPF